MADALLVTGARGALGKDLTARLRASGQRIIGLDLEAGNHADDIAGNFSDVGLLSRLLPEIRGVFHLAAVSGVADGEKDPGRCLDINLVSFTRLCEAVAASSSRPWLVAASTIEVLRYTHGEPSAPPANVYGFSKYAAEAMASYLATRHRMKIVLPRFSTLYGFRSKSTAKVLPRFVNNAMAGLPIKVLDAEGWYNFLHVDDAIAALEACMHRAANMPPGCESYLVCGAETLTLADLARRVVGQLNSSSPLDLPLADPSAPCPVYPAMATSLADWQPIIGLDHGIGALARILLAK